MQKFWLGRCAGPGSVQNAKAVSTDGPWPGPVEAAPRKRDAIAAEAAPATDVDIPNHPKTEAMYQLLGSAAIHPSK